VLELAARSVAFGHEGDFDGRAAERGGGARAERAERRFAGAGMRGVTHARALRDGVRKSDRERERQREKAHKLTRQQRLLPRDDWWGPSSRACGHAEQAGLGGENRGSLPLVGVVGERALLTAAVE